MQEICKKDAKYAEYAKDMQEICKKYARNMQNICKIYAKYMQNNMHKMQ